MMPRALVLALALMLGSAAVRAQETAPTTAAPASRPIETMAQALEFVPADDRVLLAVLPENGLKPPVPLVPSRNGHIPLRDVAAAFDRKIMRLGTVTVLVPPTMTVLNTKPGKPDLTTGLAREERLRLFQSLLTASQWRLLGSASGIGLNDLRTDDQRALFQSLLPQPFQVRKAISGREFENEKPVALSAAERAGVRLRLNRVVAFWLPSANRVNHVVKHETGVFGPSGVEGHYVFSEPAAPAAGTYGVALTQEAPNRLKPGHLPFDTPALASTVSLADAATVGDMVKRVGQAARLELHADARLATLPVWTRGESARAGDVLEALCLAVTGTFRRLDAAGNAPPAFVLTDDIEGIGTRSARLYEWLTDAAAKVREMREEADARIAAAQPLQYIGFAPDYPMALGPELAREVVPSFSRGDGKKYAASPADLPPVYRTVIGEAVAAINQIDREHQEESRDWPSYAVRGDRVWLEGKLLLSFIVPGIGPAGDSGFSGGGTRAAPLRPANSAAEPAPLPALLASFASRAAYVAPKSAEEAVRAATEAHRRGLTHLWVEVPPSGGGDTYLSAAVRAGKENKVSVLAVLPLLLTPPAPDASPESQDRNIFGETGSAYAARSAASPATGIFAWQKEAFLRPGDWLRPDAPAVSAALKQRITELAAAPGLAGLVLRDTAAPGYTGSDYYPTGREFGYTPEARIAFLRQHGVDPVDLRTRGGLSGADVTLPFFSPRPRSHRIGSNDGVGSFVIIQGSGGFGGDDSLLQAWDAFRRQANAALMRELFTAARAAKPDLPLLIDDRSHPRLNPGWYGEWIAPDRLPGAAEGMCAFDPLTQQAKTQARRTLISVNPLRWVITPTGGYGPEGKPAADTAPDFALFLNKALSAQNKGWEGVVLDLSEMPVDRALSLLDALGSTAEVQ